MNDKISVLIKSLLDKTSLTKTFNGIQSFFNQKQIHLRPKIDMKDIQKQLQTAVDKAQKTFRQNKTSASPPTAASSEKNGIGERTVFQW